MLSVAGDDAFGRCGTRAQNPHNPFVQCSDHIPLCEFPENNNAPKRREKSLNAPLIEQH